MVFRRCSTQPPVLLLSTVKTLQAGHASELCSQVSRHGPQKTFWQHVVIFGRRAIDSHSPHLNMFVFPSVLTNWSMLTLTSTSAIGVGLWATLAGDAGDPLWGCGGCGGCCNC